MKTDAELLAAYATDGDEESFAELVRRHDGTVYRACRRQLADDHEAEDAAQAVFMALAHKARSLGKGDDLAAWLHATAHSTALFAVRSRLRRRRRERDAAMTKPVFAGDSQD
jgi:RNA polymerase sigma factor (sigma-70 family)